MNPFEVVPAKTQKEHHKVGQPALLEFSSHPAQLIKQCLVNNSFAQDLCGKLVASGAKMEGAIFLKKFDPVGDLQKGDFSCPAKALIPNKIEHIDLWINTQLAQQITQFYLGIEE